MKRIVLALGFAVLASACAKQTPPPQNPPPANGDPSQQQPQQTPPPEQGQQNPSGGW